MTKADPGETILIVDDEEPVRRTFREWLESAKLGCKILTAGDAAQALALADKQPIDLAILDWNLGAGSDGLQLLEDLTEFSPDVVAILVTGFANQATPLMAMRMGVRDYLDKNHDLDRATLVGAVTRQLDHIRPARREKQVNHGLATFRSAVERILPLVHTASALNDPVPLSVAVRSLVQFVLKTTTASDGVLLVYSYEPDRHPVEIFRAYDAEGSPLGVTLVPFSRSLAGAVSSMQEPQSLDDPDRAARDGTIDLHPFEAGRANVLAAPMHVTTGLQVVLELFDKPGGFDDRDRSLLRAASDFGGELLRQALAERQTRNLLFDAVASALSAGDAMTQTLRGPAGPSHEKEAPPEILVQLQQGLEDTTAAGIDSGAILQLAEAIRVLAVRHGPRALAHCTRMVEDLRGLLDEATGEFRA